MNKFQAKFTQLTISISVFVIPAIVSAQGALNTADTLAKSIKDVVDLLIPIAAALALLGFFFGLAKYIFQAGDEDAQEEGKQIMIWGVVALFLIAAVGGIVEVLATTLGVNTGTTVDPADLN